MKFSRLDDHRSSPRDSNDQASIVFFQKSLDLTSFLFDGRATAKGSTRSFLVNTVFPLFLCSKVSERARLELRRTHRMSEHISGNILAFGRFGHLKSGRTSAPAREFRAFEQSRVLQLTLSTRNVSVCVLRGFRFVATLR